MPVMFGLIVLAEPVIHHFADFGTVSASGDYADSPIWLGLVTALTAGRFEEFIYRGLVIEELGNSSSAVAWRRPFPSYSLHWRTTFPTDGRWS
jgi:membrane protease YdiL (CAAX protease family)